MPELIAEKLSKLIAATLPRVDAAIDDDHRYVGLGAKCAELVDTYRRFAALPGGLRAKMRSEINAAKRDDASKLHNQLLEVREALSKLRTVMRGDEDEWGFRGTLIQQYMQLVLGPKWSLVSELGGLGPTTTVFDDRVEALNEAIEELESLVATPLDRPTHAPSLGYGTGPYYTAPMSEFSRREWFIALLARPVFESYFGVAGLSPAGPFQRFVNWIETEAMKQKSSGATIKLALEKAAVHYAGKGEAPQRLVDKEAERLLRLPRK